MPVYERLSLAHTAGETEVLRIAARAAEDDGDFAGALRLVRGLPANGDTEAWRGHLETAIGLPPQALALQACWLVHPALRWALERPSGEVLEGYARLMLATLGVHASDRNPRLSVVAVADPVVVDAGLFDGGLFRRYLVAALAPAVLERMRTVSQWPRSPASIWEVRTQRPASIELYDLWAEQSVECLPWAASLDALRGDLLYGRLVPVAGNVPFAFALAPTVVDRRCAVRVLLGRRRGADPDERLRAVAYSRRRREISRKSEMASATATGE